MSQKYVIVHFIDETSVPITFPSSEWPLHVTLLANFTLSASMEQLRNELRSFASREKPFEIIADGEAQFGPNQNVAVSLIQPNQDIRRVHESLSSITLRLGAVFDEPSFMHEGYRPHATIQVKSRLLDKQSITLNAFTLVDMFPDNDMSKRRIIETYKLGGK